MGAVLPGGCLTNRKGNDGSHSGLGLSMAKWIAQAHGGNVRVESELGKGSCFTFELKF